MAFFSPSVYQGGDWVRADCPEPAQPAASGPPTCNQRDFSVREQIRPGFAGELPEGRGLWPEGTGANTPHWYIVCICIQYVCVCMCVYISIYIASHMHQCTGTPTHARTPTHPTTDTQTCTLDNTHTYRERERS